MSTYTDASLIVTPNAKKASKLYALKGADLDVVRETTATYVGSDGLIKAALANEVRFDYTNGSCPSILVEPQMTNFWTDNNSNSGYSSNTGSIKGLTIPNAFGTGINGFQYTFTGGEFFVSAMYSIRIFDTRTFPIQRICLFIKNPSSDFLAINALNVGQVCYKFSTLEVDNYSLGSIRKINSDTYALYIHNNNSPTGQFTQIRVAFVQQFGNYGTISGSAIIGLGYQQGLSSGSLPNVYSPIITTTTSVTRNADVISKSGISSLIGQTEGTFYSEIQFFEGGARFNGIELFGNSGNRIYISKDTNDSIVIGFQANSINTLVGSFNSSYNKVKIAIRYKSGNSVVYVNGVNVGSNSAIFNFTAALTTLNCNVANLINYNLQGRLFSCAVFPLGLTNSELQKLTTL